MAAKISQAMTPLVKYCGGGFNMSENLVENREKRQQASSQSSTRSGGFTMHINQPERKASYTMWSASCSSGGWAYAKVEDDSKTVYCRGGSNSPGGCDVDIGVDAALGKACRGQ
jgi:hypothetical protein